MSNVRELLEQLIKEQSFLQATLSNPRSKAEGTAVKIKAKPLLLRGETVIQLEKTVGTKALHENIPVPDAAGVISELLLGTYKQGLVQAKGVDYQVLVNKKGEAAILKKPGTKLEVRLTHNRQKQYLLQEGEPVPFLVELGVMNAQGKVLSGKYDKFKQINRFLEMIADVTEHLKQNGPIHIIDFGCGKSYLTFALYHYLRLQLGLDIRVTGLDLKADVIEHCSRLAAKLGYDRLQFQVGDISRFSGAEQVDMVVTLHACDTATDAALEKAVRWGADVILSVPCCQHELFGQIRSETLAPMLSHGIVRERFATLATDSVRAQLLELLGYKSQLLEFIDMEHTPKNVLIRAVRQTHKQAYLDKQVEAYIRFKEFLQIDPYLERAMRDRLEPLLGGVHIAGGGTSGVPEHTIPQ